MMKKQLLFGSLKVRHVRKFSLLIRIGGKKGARRSLIYQATKLWWAKRLSIFIFIPHTPLRKRLRKRTWNHITLRSSSTSNVEGKPIPAQIRGSGHNKTWRWVCRSAAFGVGRRTLCVLFFFKNITKAGPVGLLPPFVFTLYTNNLWTKQQQIDSTWI